MNKWIFVFIGILIAGSIPIAQAKKGKTPQKIEMVDPYGPATSTSSGSGSSGKKPPAPTPTPTQTSRPPMVDPYN